MTDPLWLGLPVLLALGAAAAYGASDFLGGLATRVESVWAVAATSQSAAAVLALPFALATATAWPRGADLGWAAVAGVGAAGGNVLIYRGLATGRTMVVAPVAAVTSVTVPVAVDLLGGRQLGAGTVVGVVVAVLAVWLVSGGTTRTLLRSARRDVAVGLAAGLGFGTQFAALGQVPAGSGLVPVALSQIVSVAGILAVATARGRRWFATQRRGTAIGAGVLAGAATLLFQLSAQGGVLTVAAVLTSLYPAVTLLLAALVLRERATRVQLLGLLLAGLAVVLVRAG